MNIKILILILVVGAVAIIGGVLLLAEPTESQPTQTFDATPSPPLPSPVPMDEIVDKFADKVVGSVVGIGYSNQIKENSNVLAVFSVIDPDSILQEVTVEDVEEQFKVYGHFLESENIESSSQLRIPIIIYSEKFHYFMIPIEYVEYRSGSGNEFWRMFIYDEDEKTFYLAQKLYEGIDEKYNVGSFTPESMKISPNNNNLLYVTGSSGGVCIKDEHLEGISLDTLTLLDVQSDEFDALLGDFRKQDLSYEFYIQDFSWKNDKTVLIDYQIILCRSPYGNGNQEVLPNRVFEFQIQ
jgi:hypothetical protein